MIDDGYMNIVHRIKQCGNHDNSVIVKQAPLSNKVNHESNLKDDQKNNIMPLWSGGIS